MIPRDDRYKQVVREVINDMGGIVISERGVESPLRRLTHSKASGSVGGNELQLTALPIAHYFFGNVVR